MNFKAHIKEKVTKARKALYAAINKVRGTIGPHPRSLKWVYEGVALPIVTYACHVWWTRADRAELQKFNRQGCLLVAPVLDNTPTEPLEILYDIKPLNLLLEKLALEKYLNVMGTYKRTWNGLDRKGNYYKPGHVFSCEKLLKKYGLEKVGLDEKKDVCLRRTYEVTLTKTDPREEGCNIYTDGSKIGNKVGYGFICMDDQYEQQGALPDESTVFQAEIMALKKGAEHLIQKGTENEEIHVYSDSKAGLMAMLSRKTSTRLVHETKVKWNHVGTRNKVHLKWIKAHVGHEGNEKADVLAKDGTQCSKNAAFTPKSWIKGFLKEKLQEKWVKQWNDTKPDQYRHTKKWINDLSKFPQKGGLLKINNRKTVGLIAQWITSFNNLNYHSHRKDRTIDKTCRLCQKEDSKETPWHLATECERTMVHNRLHLHKFTIDNKSWSWDSLRAYLTSPMIYRLMTNRTVRSEEGDPDAC